MTSKLFFSAWLSLGCLFSAAAEPLHGDLTLSVEGFAPDRGVLMIGLFTSRETYDADHGRGDEDSKQAYQSVTAEVHDGQAEYVFERLPYGEYAIKLYHDENNNGKLDKNFTGIPKEGYGFSNNPQAFFGPASYEEARFAFSVPAKTVNVNLRTR